MSEMKILRLAFVMLAAFSIASCSNSDDPDGKWKPMEWESEVPVQTTDGVYNVSETGTEFTFSCKNYSPWLVNALSNGKYYLPEENSYHVIATDWFKAETNGKTLKVVFEANESAEERPLLLEVTAGDIFYTFRFIQFANNH